MKPLNIYGSKPFSKSDFAGCLLFAAFFAWVITSNLHIESLITYLIILLFITLVSVILLFYCKGRKIFLFYNSYMLYRENMGIIDIIKLSKTPVWGINIGQCASAAAFIYLSCHRRFMLEQGYFLFHQGSGSFSGTFQEVCAQIEDYQKQVQNLMDFMEKYTKYSKQEIEEKIIGEWYVRKEEALEKGVCDELISDISTIL